MFGAPGVDVLVVDDEATISEVVARYLTRAGHRTRTAADGPAAVASVIERRPDVLVLDVMLPGFSGLEVMRRVREQEGPAPGIILLTARGEEHDRVSGLRQGADDYLVKPFSPAETRRPGRGARAPLAVHEEPIAPGEPPLVFDGLVVDLAGRRVVVDGTEVEMTRREFDLLAFPRLAGRAFDRDQLMDAVWAFPFYTDTSTVTVHVRRVRSKIEADPANPVRLQTVWGVGYRFSA
ncbi:MAG: response regulator transcription factor [Actinobacteria bacterium]|nr:response regulator transcription factor [Actinomycetota bacterium]